MNKNWTYKKLGDICEIYQPQTISTEMLVPDGKYLVYGANGIIGRYDKYNHVGPEVLLTCRGATCGSINVSEPYSWINGNAMVIHPIDDTMFHSLSFLVYLMKSIDYSVVITGAAQPQITRQKLSPLKVAIPPIRIQKRIVAELDLLTGVIEKQKAQLKELDNLAQSIFYDMFGDVVNNEKAWNVVPLRLLCSITSSKRIFASEYCQSGIPFFRGKEVSEKSFGLKTSVELFISKKRYDEIRDAYGVPSMGDILLTAVGTIGNVWVVDDDAPFYFKDGNILWLKLREGINPVYFRFVLLKLVDAYKSSMAKGCAYNALTIVNLKEMPTVDTPYCFQNEFAHKIQSIENQKTLIKKSIEETQKLFDYTMDKYFG